MHKMTVTVLAFRKKDQNTQMVKRNTLLYYDHTRQHKFMGVLILFQNTSYDDDRRQQSLLLQAAKDSKIIIGNTYEACFNASVSS